MGMGGGNGGSGETVYRSLVRAVSDAVGHGATFGAVWALRVHGGGCGAAACGRGWWRGRNAECGVVCVRMREWGCAYLTSPIY